MRLLIQNGRVVCPASLLDTRADLLLEGGKIAELAPGGYGKAPAAVLVYDAAGKLVAPGLVDMHVHLRDPGQTHKEDIISGTAAAAAGGVTSLCCMPNTTPPIDSPELVRYITTRARWGSARVYPCAAITEGLRGEKLCCYRELKRAGAVAVSDDGRPVADGGMMAAAAVAAQGAGLLPISHCEHLGIINGGIMNLGEVSRQLGVPGMDRRSEDSITAREIAIAKSTGAHIHIAHVSTKGAVQALRQAKAEGVPVSAETGPHYFSLTDEALRGRDANFRMNPPLRLEEDRLAVIEGLRDGTLDAIATDHAPHTPQEKADFCRAPNGVVGLETSFMAAYTLLVRPGLLPLMRLLELMSLAPARLLGIPAGTLEAGANADVAVFDLEREVEVLPQALCSRARNTPFAGRHFYGPCVLTVCGGKIVHQRG